jgi:hypothetical protein
MAGRPLVLLEYHKDRYENVASPSHTKRVELPHSLRINLDFILLNESEGEVPAWIIGALPQSQQQNVRDLRLYLARLHSESECLARVLHGLALGVIAPKRGTPESNNLQQYLRDSIKRLEKLSKQQEQYFQKEVFINLAGAAIENVQRGISSTLHKQAVEQLTRIDARPSIIEAAGRIAPLIHIENLMTGDYLSNSNQTTISGSSIGSINNSFNNAIGKAQTDDLKNHLTELKTYVEKLCEASPEKAKEIAKHFDKFTTEATDSAPSKDYLNISSAGLVSAANTLSMLVVPISDIINRIISLVCP